MQKPDSREPESISPAAESKCPDPSQECSAADSHDADETAEVKDSDTLPPLRFAAVLLSVCSASFFAGYDATCVGTIAPIITDEFHSISDVSWYGIAYSLASCATILTYGKLYSFFSERSVFASSLAIFVVGSIVCATAPSSVAFILGRTIAGLGNAGILSGCNIILARVTPLRWRPFYQSLVGGVECAALAGAPLLAGAIANHTSWRVCFYISIPFGAVPIIIVLLVMRIPRTSRQSPVGVKAKLGQLDLPGMVLFVPLVVCLISALQWGGTVYAWGDVRLIVLLVVAGLLAVGFTAQQNYAGENATLPLKLFRSRTLVFGMIFIFSTSGTLYVFTYYLPVYYQAIEGTSVLGSGLRDLSRMLGLVIALLASGFLTSFIGYYTPGMLLGSALMSVGAGLTTTFHPSTTLGHVIAYQAIFGLGCGFAFQQPYIAVQTGLPSTDVPAAIVFLTFVQFLGNIVLLAASQNVLTNRLASGLTSEIPQVDPAAVLNSGALNLKSIVPAQYLSKVLQIYNEALNSVFRVGLVAACVTVVGALGSEWKSIKKSQKANTAQKTP